MKLIRTIVETIKLRAYGLLRIPLVAAIAPVVEDVDEDRCVLRVPLGYVTKNHLGAMYFGALCTGADVTAGVIAMERIAASPHTISFVFKDVQASFLKRATGDVVFTCPDGRAITALVERAAKSGEREETPVRVVATVPSAFGDAPVATFTMTMSLKRR